MRAFLPATRRLRLALAAACAQPQAGLPNLLAERGYLVERIDFKP